QHGDGDGQSGQGADPPGIGQVVPSGGQHQTPGDVRWLYPQAEEAQGGFDDDHGGYAEGGEHDKGRHHIGQDVPQQDPRAVLPEILGSFDELALADLEDLGADLPGVDDPVGDA